MKQGAVRGFFWSLRHRLDRYHRPVALAEFAREIGCTNLKRLRHSLTLEGFTIHQRYDGEMIVGHKGSSYKASMRKQHAIAKKRKKATPKKAIPPQTDNFSRELCPQDQEYHTPSVKIVRSDDDILDLKERRDAWRALHRALSIALPADRCERFALYLSLASRYRGRDKGPDPEALRQLESLVRDSLDYGGYEVIIEALTRLSENRNNEAIAFTLMVIRGAGVG